MGWAGAGADHKSAPLCLFPLDWSPRSLAPLPSPLFPPIRRASVPGAVRQRALCQGVCERVCVWEAGEGKREDRFFRPEQRERPRACLLVHPSLALPALPSTSTLPALSSSAHPHTLFLFLFHPPSQSVAPTPPRRPSVATAATTPSCGPAADPARRVVITGMGVVSCLGHDPDTFYNALLAGQSGVKAIEGWDTTDFSTKFAGQIRDFDPGVYIDKKNARRMDDVIKVSVRVCVCVGLGF